MQMPDAGREGCAFGGGATTSSAPDTSVSSAALGGAKEPGKERPGPQEARAPALGAALPFAFPLALALASGTIVTLLFGTAGAFLAPIFSQNSGIVIPKGFRLKVANRAVSCSCVGRVGCAGRSSMTGSSTGSSHTLALYYT